MRKSRSKFFGKTYFIFGEGDSEKYYFYNLKKLDKYKHFHYKQNVKPEEIKSILKNLSKIIGHDEKLIKSTNSKVIFVVDIDIFSSKEVDEIKNLEKKYSYVKILFNSKNFEDFLLLHLKYFNVEKDSIKRLEKIIGTKYEKGLKGVMFYKKCIENGFNNDFLKNNLEKLDNYFGKERHLKEKIPFSELGSVLFE